MNIFKYVEMVFLNQKRKLLYSWNTVHCNNLFFQDRRKLVDMLLSTTKIKRKTFSYNKHKQKRQRRKSKREKINKSSSAIFKGVNLFITKAPVFLT